ncbi:MAG: insulinase family protein [Acidobacteria bacterium]|nr:insulinase family protein [Acidobacteriota bacterium]
MTGTTKSWRTTAPEPRTARPWDLPEISVVTLESGIRIVSASHGAAPIDAVRVVVRAGSDHDPEGLEGLAGMTASLLDEGAGGQSGADLDHQLGLLGASIDAGADWDSSQIHLDVLAENLDPAMTILRQVTCEPNFDPDDLERVREERITMIHQSLDDPAHVASRFFSRFVYGPGRYGTPAIGTEGSLRSIGRETLEEFHADYYVPANISVVAVGASAGERLHQATERAFAGWKPSTTGPAVSLQPGPVPSGFIHVIDRPGSVQSEIRVGHPGVSRRTEDYFPLLVMNGILGDAFNSRIMINLRERHGWTYGAQSSFLFRRHAGPFVVSTAVRNDVTAPAVSELLSEIGTMRNSQVSPEELEHAKSYIAGSFPSTVETAGGLAVQLQEVELYELPRDFLRTYRERIMEVTREDVERVARKYLDPDGSVIVIVGAGSELAEAVKQLGRPVRNYQLDGTPLEES